MLYIFVCAGFLSACLGGMRPIATRPLYSLEKAEGPMEGYARDIETPVAPELYARRKEINVQPKDPVNENGSLINLDDARNYLFVARPPLKEGDYVDIAVKSRHQSAAADGGAPQAGAASAEKPVVDKASGDNPDADLISAIPSLEPGNAADAAKLLRQIKMQITHRYENGDVLANLVRRSTTGDGAAEVVVQARIPHERLISAEPLTTDDLIQVSWAESKDGALTERSSTSWEDDYTMRLSGFDEAKSKEAVALDAKREELRGVKEKLDMRIKALSKERQLLAKQRSEIAAAAEKAAESDATKGEKTAADTPPTEAAAKPAAKPESPASARTVAKKDDEKKSQGQ